MMFLYFVTLYYYSIFPVYFTQPTNLSVIKFGINWIRCNVKAFDHRKYILRGSHILHNIVHLFHLVKIEKW